jgi:hypothetical protein
MSDQLDINDIGDQQPRVNKWYEAQRDERKRQVLAGAIPGDIVRDRRERSKRLFDDIVKRCVNRVDQS